MPYTVTDTAYLEINSIPLATPAWRILDLTPLYGMVMRGNSEPVPYVAGAIGYRHRVDFRSVTLPIDVYGRLDSNGVAYANHWTGLDANIAALWAGIVVPGTSTYPAIWHQYAGGTKTADVFVEAFTPTMGSAGIVRFDLELSIPAGKFA